MSDRYMKRAFSRGDMNESILSQTFMREPSKIRVIGWRSLRSRPDIPVTFEGHSVV